MGHRPSNQSLGGRGQRTATAQSRLLYTGSSRSARLHSESLSPKKKDRKGGKEGEREQERRKEKRMGGDRRRGERGEGKGGEGRRQEGREERGGKGREGKKKSKLSDLGVEHFPSVLKAMGSTSALKIILKHPTPVSRKRTAQNDRPA